MHYPADDFFHMNRFIFHSFLTCKSLQVKRVFIFQQVSAAGEQKLFLFEVSDVFEWQYIIKNKNKNKIKPYMADRHFQFVSR